MQGEQSFIVLYMGVAAHPGGYCAARAKGFSLLDGLIFVKSALSSTGVRGTLQ